MRITVAAVGKPRNAALAAAIAEYESRARRYWPIDVVEVREVSARGRRPDEVRRGEAERLRAAVPRRAAVWLCDERGAARTSAQFAAWLQRGRESGRDLAFVVGGAHGLDASLRSEAAGAVSLGPLTLPHELARLVLAEQLYRAGTIVRGEPYHKA